MEAIDITEYLGEFKVHIDLNERTIFSAKFGDGKTYFLNEFKKRNEDSFYFITIYPVNYSVAENVDIFEYIKRDIIVQLANDDILSNIDFTSIADTLFSWENAREVVSFLLSFVPAGGLYNKLLDKGKRFYDVYEKKKKTYAKYSNCFEEQKGGLYEDDAYTRLIENAIRHIQKNMNKKVVLIFEDLDRIDPAHLFRILNVLGANIDCQFNNGKSCKLNKFGVDNIVTVFDYEVTRHIFHHFYGENANYEGYISKFMTHHYYQYSINKIGKDYLYGYLAGECGMPDDKLSNIHYPISSRDTLTNIIDKLTIRDIMKILDEIELQIDDRIIVVSNDISFRPITPLTKFLAIMKRMNISLQLRQLNPVFGDPVDIFNYIGCFLLVDNNLANRSSLTYRGKPYNIHKEKESENIVSRIELVNARAALHTDNDKIVLSSILDCGFVKAISVIKP